MTKPRDTPWHAVERGSETVYVHPSGDLWAANYEAINGADYVRPEHWSVYRAIERGRKGAQPWSRNNKSLGDFPTLEAAVAAGDAWIEANAKEAA